MLLPFKNVANAYRAAGKLAESLEVYKEVFSIYNENIPSDDYRMASLNNNIALLYQEMNDFPMAVQHLKKATVHYRKNRRNGY